MAQGYIESTNIGISSINSCKALHTGTASDSPNSSINDLRNWFRDNIGSRGNFKNSSASGQRVDFSDFGGTGIYGFWVHAWSETTSTYEDTDDGGVTLWANRGNDDVNSFKFWLEGRGWVVPNGANNTGTNKAFHALSSGTYTVHIEHLDFPRQTFYITIGYGVSSTMTYYYTNSAGKSVEVLRTLPNTAVQYLIGPNKFKSV